MPGPITITDGGYCEQDSDERKVYQFDFDTLNLPAGAELTSAGTLLVLPNDSSLTTDSLALVPGSNNRKVQVRLGTATTVGVKYSIRLRVTTNETPQQIKEKGFTLRIKS